MAKHYYKGRLVGETTSPDYAAQRARFGMAQRKPVKVAHVEITETAELRKWWADERQPSHVPPAPPTKPSKVVSVRVGEALEKAKKVSKSLKEKTVERRGLSARQAIEKASGALALGKYTLLEPSVRESEIAYSRLREKAGKRVSSSQEKIALDVARIEAFYLPERKIINQEIEKINDKLQEQSIALEEQRNRIEDLLEKYEKAKKDLGRAKSGREEVGARKRLRFYEKKVNALIESYNKQVGKFQQKATKAMAWRDKSIALEKEFAPVLKRVEREQVKQERILRELEESPITKRFKRVSKKRSELQGIVLQSLKPVELREVLSKTKHLLPFYVEEEPKRVLREKPAMIEFARVKTGRIEGVPAPMPLPVPGRESKQVFVEKPIVVPKEVELERAFKKLQIEEESQRRTGLRGFRVEPIGLPSDVKRIEKLRIKETFLPTIERERQLKKIRRLQVEGGEISSGLYVGGISAAATAVGALVTGGAVLVPAGIAFASGFVGGAVGERVEDIVYTETGRMELAVPAGFITTIGVGSVAGKGFSAGIDIVRLKALEHAVPRFELHFPRGKAVFSPKGMVLRGKISVIQRPEDIYFKEAHFKPLRKVTPIYETRMLARSWTPKPKFTGRELVKSWTPVKPSKPVSKVPVIGIPGVMEVAKPITKKPLKPITLEFELKPSFFKKLRIGFLKPVKQKRISPLLKPLPEPLPSVEDVLKIMEKVAKPKKGLVIEGKVEKLKEQKELKIEPSKISILEKYDFLQKFGKSDSQFAKTLVKPISRPFEEYKQKSLALFKAYVPTKSKLFAKYEPVVFEKVELPYSKFFERKLSKFAAKQRKKQRVFEEEVVVSPTYAVVFGREASYVFPKVMQKQFQYSLMGQRSKLIEKLLQKQISIVEPMQLQLPKEVGVVRPMQSIMEKFIQSQPIVSMQLPVSFAVQRSKSIQKLLQRQIPIIKPMQLQKIKQVGVVKTFQPTVERAIQLQHLVSLQLPVSLQLQKTVSVVKPKPITLPKFKPISPKPLKVKGFKLIGLGFFKKRKKVPGFFVFVKEKGYFKASSEAMPKNEALAFGASLVDNSTARGFKLVKAKKLVAPSLLPKPLLLGKFRRAKRNRKVFVEKSTFAIDSWGELQGITAKGLLRLKQLRELGLPVKKRKKRKKKRRKRK